MPPDKGDETVIESEPGLAGAGEVVRVDVATGDTEVVGGVGAGRDNFAINAEDRLFVSSGTDSSIIEVTGPETIRTVVPGGISWPGGLAYMPSPGGSGRLFVADRRALRELDPVTGEEVHAVRVQVMSAHRLTQRLPDSLQSNAIAR